MKSRLEKTFKMSQRVHRIMTQPIVRYFFLMQDNVCVQNLIFRFLQNRQRVQIWIFEQKDMKIEGTIIVRQNHL